jgi:MFS family permease
MPDMQNRQHPPEDAMPRRRAWAVFALLFALMVFNYVDRQVVVSMFPHLAGEWRRADSELGWLVSIVSLTVAVGAVPLSFLADRHGRDKAIFAMAIVWSVATIACAFAASYAQLLWLRAIVGAGEAAFGAVGAALLATLFPERVRSTVLGAFLSAALVGSVLGVTLGGVVAERWGWQWAFGIAGAPGLVLAAVFIAVLRDHDPTLLRRSEAATRDRWSAGLVVRGLLRPRTAVAACLGAGLQLAVVATMYAWLPTYLHRFHGVAADDAALRAALVVAVSGFGTLAWSGVADRASARFPRARLQVPIGVALSSAALLCSAFAFVSPGDAQFALILVGAAVMTGTIGPVAAVVVDVVQPGIRATATAVLALSQNLLGLGLGPLVAGFLSEAFGLGVALALVPSLCVVAAAAFAVASRTYVPDVRAAREDGSALPIALSASRMA